MRTSLNVVQGSADRLAAQRSCGPCTACCVLPRVRVDEGFPQGKPGYVKCEHLCNSGCGIYNERPPVCLDFVCLWRAGIIEGDERRRPDQLGLMFTLEEDNEGIRVEAWELWDGAAENHPGRYLLDRVARDYPLSIRFYGVPCSIHYDAPGGVYEIGRTLSQWSRNDPKALGEWLDRKAMIGALVHDPEGVASALADLESLRRGEPVERHYQRGA